MKMITVNSEIFGRFIFCETSHMRCFVKIKSTQIGEIFLSFTDISKSRPCCEFLTLQICVLTLFVKIKYSLKFPNLQYVIALNHDFSQILSFCHFINLF